MTSAQSRAFANEVTCVNAPRESVLAAIAKIQTRLNAVAPPLETAATLPPACYSDPAWYQHELGRIFHRAWLSVGRTDQWAAPGDYVALEVAGVPVIVLRDECGRLRAFANTCRHRGTLLLEGSGNTSLITCPFHGWCYGLDGALRGAPSMGRVPHFNHEQLGLVPFRVDTRDGFVFLCFDEGAASLDEWLGDFSERHAEWRLDRLVTTHRRELEVACNWKAFLEVFCEWYHLPYTHRDTLGELYAPPDAMDESRGCYTTQFGETQGRGGLLADRQDDELPLIPSLAGRNRQGARYTWVFPNLALSANPDSVWAYQAYPLGPARTRVTLFFCVPPETTASTSFEARARGYHERLERVLDEDIAMLERQQRGLCTPHGRQGRFCPTLEPMVATFACWYAAHTGTGGHGHDAANVRGPADEAGDRLP